jgi:N6-adenosine-specific RNA methylase IME4
MMADNVLALRIKKQVRSIPEALTALTRMERELTTAKTYDDIRRVIKEAEALKVLLGHVVEVKAKAEDAILVGSTRIGEEIKKVPKASGGDRRSKVPRRERLKSGREAIGLPKVSRSRLTKLADKGIPAVKKAAQQLRAEGKDATPRAVATYLTQGDKKERRAEREQQLGVKIKALPDIKAGVIVADPEWRWEPWSRETGMDRAADNHYPTSVLDVIKSRPVEKIAADDCVLFLWATIPMLPHALLVMAVWDFDYVSHYAWGKDKIGTGFWSRERHELLLIGTRGKVVCPAQGTQLDSLIMAPRGEHSEKPECFLEMIERYFPTVPKIELNRRGPPRPGWDAWGNEVSEAAE